MRRWRCGKDCGLRSAQSGGAVFDCARCANGEGLNGELYVVYVDLGADDNEANQKTLAANVRFAETVGAQVAKLKSPRWPKRWPDFVREKHITQVVFGHSAMKGWKTIPLSERPIHNFSRDAPPVDVHIVTQESS